MCKLLEISPDWWRVGPLVCTINKRTKEHLWLCEKHTVWRGIETLALMNSSFVSLTVEEIKAEGKSSCQRNTRHLVRKLISVLTPGLGKKQRFSTSLNPSRERLRCRRSVWKTLAMDIWQNTCPWGWILPIMAYTGRLRSKGVPISAFTCMKG